MNCPSSRNFCFSILSILALISGGVSKAEEEKITELKTLSGKTFHDVRVAKVTPVEISIIHESGAARIPMKDLPDDLKGKFGYDPAKAEAHAIAAGEAEKQTADAQKKRAENDALLKTAEARVFIVDRETNDGLLVTSVTAEFLEFIDSRQMSARFAKERGESGKNNYDIVGTGGGVVVDSSYRGDQQALLIGIPKKEQYVQDSAIGGLFVVAGTALSNNGTRIKMFRFVGLKK